MSADEAMWTPLESALSPFKELARLNRRTITDAAGQSTQLVLRADRCRVLPDSGNADPAGRTVELGFSLGADAYAVSLVAGHYRRDGRWDFDRLQSDISTRLQSGALKPGTSSPLSMQ